MRQLKDQRGVVMILELVLVVAVLAVAGLGINMAMHHKSPSAVVGKVTPAPSKSASPTPDPYAGWNSYTLKNEKIHLKYPSGWTLSDKTASAQTTDSKGQLIYSPGSDYVTLIANDSLSVGILTAPTQYDAGGPQSVVSSSPIKLLGSTYYVNFMSVMGSPGNAINAGFYVVKHASDTAESTSSFPLTKNIVFGPGANSPSIQDSVPPYILTSINYSQPSNIPHPVSKYQSDPNYATALKILESMSY